MKIILYPLSLLYYCITLFRLWCYKYNVFTKHIFDIPIISVGNIAVGGTGKTPMTIYLAKLLTNKNINHVIVSRGYKKQSTGTIVVNDGLGGGVASVKQCGDEPFFMAQKLPTTPIVVGSNKRAAIEVAIQTFQPKIIILDDAFQSHYIDRTIDIVLFNCLEKEKNFHLFPAGSLRELPRALLRSQLVVFTKHNLLTTKLLPAPSQKIVQLLKYHKIPFLFSNYTSSYKEYCLETQSFKLKKYDNKNQSPILAMSGIGDSKSFDILCNQYFTNIVKTQNFTDHYHYKNICSFLEAAYNIKSFSGIVTTYKDFIKLETTEPNALGWLKQKSLKIFILEIELCLKDDLKLLPKLIKSLDL